MKLTPPDSQNTGGSGTSRRRFTFDLVQSDQAAVITLAGEFDVVCADSFKRRFAEATEDEPEGVVIDLRELTFIDSTGLSLLLSVNEMARDRGFSLWMVSTEDGASSKIFRLTGTHTVLPLVAEPPDFAH